MVGKKRGRPALVNGEAPSVKRRKDEKVTHRSHGKKEGQVLALGEGDVGQLGLGPDIMERTKPARVDLPPDVLQAVAGGMHTVVLNAQGEVFTFGCNDEGALGRTTPEEDDCAEPGKVDLPCKMVMVSAGDSHTAALSETGRLFLWGTFRDASGSIGLTATGDIERTPIEIMKDIVTVKIASGVDHVAALADDGVLFTVGNSEQGQLGRVAECFSVRGGRKGLKHLLEPGEVHCKKRKVRFSDVWTGQYSTYGLDRETGGIYSWGLNNYFQLGFHDMKNRYVPDLASSFSRDKQWQQIEGGQHHALALDGDGKIYALGRKEYGRLGLGEDCTEKSEPTLIPVLSDKKCVGIASGTAMSLAVTEEGEIYAWGMGTSKQLGQSDEDDLWVPTLMTGKQLETRKGLSVSAGGQHTIVTAKDQS